MQILKFSNMKYFLYFDSCDDEPTKMAVPADRMKRTRESNFFYDSLSQLNNTLTLNNTFEVKGQRITSSAVN